ncbi:DUF2934 domain-containing protein [Methylomicrobium album]|uniref:DUF2934 domain-containing protein n=1 Tax=Methylomicrobium album BG8 TaxID=686340 RepID=H8GMI9_METAL|nr:DUF2934 domain-containing protein [Methylomicrobium album]EIC28229.1 Protein of unknown function (DUF2934) [Methylomicrobium album BG8]
MNMSAEFPPRPNGRDCHDDSPDPCGAYGPEGKRSRHEWIAVAAYFKAEKRGFTPGRELEDWLEAELEYAKSRVENFLQILEEDGAPTMRGLQALAQSIGVERPERFSAKTDLIQAIQCACQTIPCFRIGTEETCRQVPDCKWRSECKKLIAEWKRHEKHQ